MSAAIEIVRRVCSEFIDSARAAGDGDFSEHAVNSARTVERRLLEAFESAQPEQDLTPIEWLAANGIDTAPFTGTDARAVQALAAAWDLYAYTRSDYVLRAIRELLSEMQPKCRPLTKKLIARSMDWSDVDKLWPWLGVR